MVSDAGVAGAGLLRQVALPLQAETFAEVPPEPPIEVVDTIAARIKASGADAVIALGGGSVMDAAKVASLCARHNKAAREFVGIGKAGGRGLPTVLIPTTAGTGSEATFVAILTDPTSSNKVGVVDPCILADIAIVDPALTDGLPSDRPKSFAAILVGFDHTGSCSSSRYGEDSMLRDDNKHRKFQFERARVPQ